MTTPTRPLHDIRILDLSRLIPGPFLTMVLADMGADVIKIEDPTKGDYLRQMPPIAGSMSGRYLALNRNKRSLILNLKQERGREAFLKMVESVDVVVESFRPGVMQRLGLDYESLRKRNSQIILASISGYGQTGSYRERAGHDLNYIALSGLLAMSGSSDGPPSMPGTQVADFAGGGLWGVTAVLGALLGRVHNGGQHLDISMCEGSLALMSAELGNLACQASAPTRGREMLNGGLACYAVYETRDRKHLSVGALEPKFWLAFNKAIGRTSCAKEIGVPADEQRQIAEEIATRIAEKDQSEWVEIFSKQDCCTEAVLGLDELQEHPLHQSRKVFFTIPSAEGDLLQIRTPVGIRDTNQPPPAHGQDSREILKEFSFSDEEIQTLLKAGPDGAETNSK